jgi:deoxyribodipyrimidine photo-lyase
MPRARTRPVVPHAPAAEAAAGDATRARRVAADPRLKLRRDGEPKGSCVVYWMQRAQRVHDNPALDFAAAEADRLGVPVYVFLAPVPFYPRAGLRAYSFLFGGVPDLAREAAARGFGFVYRPFPHHRLADFVRECDAALVVGDENPLRETEAWRVRAAAELRTPFVTVDADVVVPTALFPKQEWAARTLRPKHRREQERFLRPGANAAPRVKPSRSFPGADPAQAAVPAEWRIDRSVKPAPSFPPGPAAARRALAAFVRRGLRGYATARNHPDLAATSRLSPYLHFGHLGALETALAVRDADAPDEDREAFLEEFLVRRELAINYVARNPRYDELAGGPAWALKTLDEHRRDPRPWLYDRAQLTAAQTHDPLWNAAQLEMTRTGHMHGYVRMYWAKKILEWSRTPEEAFATALELNDAYELDGRDPNGFTGVAWAIVGVHDRPWGPPRPVFGTVRFMSGASTGRKFDSAAYCARIAATPEP